VLEVYQLIGTLLCMCIYLQSSSHRMFANACMHAVCRESEKPRSAQRSGSSRIGLHRKWMRFTLCSCLCRFGYGTA
jgi:hypothetical protein